MGKLGLLAGPAIVSAATLVAEPATAQAPPGAGRRNIVFILMDNLGYGELGV